MNKEEVVKKLGQFGDALITFTDGSYQVGTMDLSNSIVQTKTPPKHSKAKIAVFSWSKYEWIVINPEYVSGVGPCPVTNRR